MAVFTIAGLTLKEAMRRRTFVGALLLGLLVLGISLLLIRIRISLEGRVASGRHGPEWFAMEYLVARSVITTLCLSSIRILGSLFAILLAGGSISGEIERGLMAVILPKPIHRWQILLGKWLGINIILVASVLVWTTMVWASLTWQTGESLTAILRAAPYLALYPVVIGTLTLALSTFAQRLLGTSLALTLSAFSWFDGILNGLGDKEAFDVEALRVLANVASLVVPQGSIAWWVKNTTQDIIHIPPRALFPGSSPEFLKEWGIAHLHWAHLDAVYVLLYIIGIFCLGAVAFHRRDV